MKIGEAFPLQTGFVQKPAELLAPKNESENESGIDEGMKELFSTVFAATNSAYEEASAVSKEMTTKLMLGELEDMPAYLVAGEKASTLFELNIRVRTKVLDAYSEIMKTQI